MDIIVDEKNILIKKTTKNKRRDIIYGHIGLATSSELNPGDEMLLEMYIEGNIELSEAIMTVLERYNKKGV